MVEPRTPNPEPRKVFIVAGEVSGDIQAARLTDELRRAHPALEIVGVGGARMAASGVRVRFDSSDWGVIGHLAPMLRLGYYLRRLRDVKEAIVRERPDVLILVDFPGFNLMLANSLRRRLPIAYYAPPMVSVRRGRRAQSVAALGMRLLATLPFEADAYTAAGADVTFVGHPAVDMVRPRGDASSRRTALGLRDGSRVIGLLPGSRRQEIVMLLPPMLAAAQRLGDRDADLEFILPVPAAHLRPVIDRMLARAGLPVAITLHVYDAMAESTVLIVASGTATLEAAILGIPMVVVYRLPWASAAIASAMLRARVVSLPNLLAGRMIVPELLQDEMTPNRLAAEVDRLLHSPSLRTAMSVDLRAAAARAGPPGAVARAAAEILAMVDRSTGGR